MARSTLKDPLKIFNFLVIIPGGGDAATVAGFKEVAGLDMTMAIDEIRGGGQNHAPRLSLGLPSFGEVTLRRGQVIDLENALGTDLFYNWSMQSHHFQADGRADFDPRRDVKILQRHRHGLTARSWLIKECLVSYYKPFKDLDGTATGDADSVEEIRFRHEGFGDPDGIPTPAELGGTLAQFLGVN